jgi:hypothetical protein
MDIEKTNKQNRTKITRHWLIYNNWLTF